MLVLSRKLEESIVIGSSVVVKVVAIRGRSVQLAFEAPPEVSIHRGEIHARIEAERRGEPHNRAEEPHNRAGNGARRQRIARNEPTDLAAAAQ